MAHPGPSPYRSFASHICCCLTAVAWLPHLMCCRVVESAAGKCPKCSSLHRYKHRLYLENRGMGLR